MPSGKLIYSSAPGIAAPGAFFLFMRESYFLYCGCTASKEFVNYLR